MAALCQHWLEPACRCRDGHGELWRLGGTGADVGSARCRRGGSRRHRGRAHAGATGACQAFYPKVWKAAAQVASGQGDWTTLERQVESVAQAQPVALRHVLDFNFPEVVVSPAPPEQVDAGLTDHALPFVIGSMSFGSQGEVAFRAYAEAAFRLNMIALNGEGGEIRDMLGKYPHNRGQQIASGRFGVTAELLNSSNLLEIKVGQGAKPGEGGHLPGVKVTAKIAQTRHSQPGTDLISPSNNHDIYSIEDLAQFIEELKTANPKARVAVKVPVVRGLASSPWALPKRARTLST